MASYNVNTRKWIRVNGKAEVENSIMIRDEMINKYPLLKQKFFDETEMFLVIFRLLIHEISIY